MGLAVRISNPASGTEWGWAVITGFTDATHVVADVKRAFATTDATDSWRLGAWGGECGWPGAVTFQEQRLCFAATVEHPQTFWMSQSADFENMAPDSPFDKALNSVPIAPGITAHSIIAVEGDGPVETGKDGVVAYKSAHITGVESELVVRSPHSCQANPHTIEEVRRILLEHSAAVFDGDRCRMVPVSR